MKTFKHYRSLWNLRTTCALLSLDIVQPFWDELGFGGSLGDDLRDASRQLLQIWWDQEGGNAVDTDKLESEGLEYWRDWIKQGWGESVAMALIAISDELHMPELGSWQHAWTELLARLPSEIDQGSRPPISPTKLEAVLEAARRYTTASKAAHDRVDAISTATASAWDDSLLRRDFYPDDEPSDRKFDPDTWLWKLLNEREWRRFAADLRDALTADELQAFIIWGAERPGNVFGRHLSKAL